MNFSSKVKITTKKDKRKKNLSVKDVMAKEEKKNQLGQSMSIGKEKDPSISLDFM